jgi:hypothetical protein
MRAYLVASVTGQRGLEAAGVTNTVLVLTNAEKMIVYVNVMMTVINNGERRQHDSKTTPMICRVRASLRQSLTMSPTRPLRRRASLRRLHGMSFLRSKRIA